MRQKASQAIVSPFGYCPVRKAALSGDKTSLEFLLADAAASSTSKNKSKKVLCDLAYNGAELLKTDDEHLMVRISRDRVRELAGSLGPLFGPGAHESLASWVEAIAIAQYAVQIQLTLNSRLPLEALEDFIAKTVARSTASDASFTLCYCNAAVTSGEYLGALASMPQVHRFGPGRYTFATLAEEDNATILSVAALSCNKEMTASDLLEAVDFFTEELSVQQYEVIKSQLADAGLDTSAESYEFFSGDASFLDEEEFLGEEDAETLTMLRDALTLLHVADIEVDLFRQEGESLLRFPHYLAYLWYEFALEAQELRVGFCDYCGRGFNMRNWRGRTKHFCPQCKDAARNNRNRDVKFMVRRMFVEEGHSLAHIAREVYPGDDAGEAQERIRAELATYPKLKRMLALEPDGDLAHRCAREGIVIKPRKPRSDKGVRR